MNESVLRLNQTEKLVARCFPFWEEKRTRICRSNSLLSSIIKNVVAVP